MKLSLLPVSWLFFSILGKEGIAAAAAAIEEVVGMVGLMTWLKAD